jgi:uncharacterized membrane protein HdeD (DUF308 family)
MNTPASLASPAAAFHRYELLVIHSDWQFYLLKGILALVMGFLAVVSPNISTLGIEQLVGWFCILGGFMWTSRIVRRHQRRGAHWRLSSSVVVMTLGVLLVRSPAEGAVALTLVIMGLFIIAGMVTILIGLRSAPTLRNWVGMPGAGLVALFFAYLMWEAWPDAATWASGILGGIVMICLGTRLIFRVIAANGIQRAKA